MSHKITTISFVTIGAAMIAISVYFSHIEKTTLIANDKNEYDIVSHQFTQNQYDKSGHLASTSKTPVLHHYINGDYSIFESPHFILHNKQGEWIIDAAKGKSINQNEKVTLWGNVTMVQPATKTSPMTTILTDHATIYPSKSYAKTDAYVTINRGHTVIEGLGATANLKSGIITLLSQTRGHYVPTQAFHS